MSADLRAAAQQALDWLYDNDILHPTKVSEDLRAALAQQDETVEPVAQFNLNTMPGQADAHLRALLRYTENFYATAIEHGMRAGPTANVIAHVERAGKALHQIVHAQAKMLEPAQLVEPVAQYQKRGKEVLTSHLACRGREDAPWLPIFIAPP